MRVAHFVQRYPPALGGSEAYFARLSRHLAAHGDQVSVFTTTAQALEAFWDVRVPCLSPGVSLDQGVEVRRYPLWRMPGRRYLLKPLSLLPNRLWQCLTLPCNPIAPHMWADCGLAEQSFDIIHATAFPYAWPIACARRLARRLRVPYVLTPFLHLGDPLDPQDRIRRAYTTPALTFLLREAQRVFVQTESERAAVIGLGIAATNVLLQGMGFDEAECAGGDRHAFRRRCQLADDVVVIGHLANNSVEKGSVDLLQTAQRLWQQGQRFHVVLAGPEMPNFQKFWQAFAPAGNALRLGVLDDRQKRDFFAGIDIFALPSRSDSFGIVLLEAWANAVPCVGYRAGGVADVIHDGADGYLVRCGAIDELAHAFRRLIEDKNLRERMGQSGYARTRHEFQWEDKLEMVRRVYHDLCDLSLRGV